MAATPPPCASIPFAALTIASTGSSSRFPCTIWNRQAGSMRISARTDAGMRRVCYAARCSLRGQFVRLAARVDRVEAHRAAPDAANVLDDAIAARHVEAAAVACVVVREHERSVLLHLGRGDARRAVVEFRREDRLADRAQVARDDADLAVVLRLEREQVQLLR